MDNPPESSNSAQNRLSIQQSRFVDAYLANGGNARQAMVSAGYDAPQNSWRVKNLPCVQAEIRKRQERFLVSDMATTALSVLSDLMQNSKNDQVKVRAATFVVEAAGLSLKGDKASGKGQKSLAECSLAELEQRARELEATVIKGPIIDAGAQGSAPPDDSNQ